MAVGKGRNKRSSGGNSYASTITTVLFVALCIFGIWMLNPNLFYPSTITTTTRTAISHSKSFPTTITKQNPTFQDNPGDLPDDAIKTDQDDNKDDVSTDDGNNNIEEKQDLMEKQELEPGITSTESDNVNIIKEPEEENVKQPVEENPEGLQGKVSEEEQQKLNEHEIQLSEESTMTHNQQTDQEIDTKSKSIEKTFEVMEGTDQQTKDEEQPSSSKNDDGEESKTDEENQKNSVVDDQAVKQDSEKTQEEEQKEPQSENLENSKDNSNLVTDEENEQRMEQQQQQEEEQVKHSKPHKGEEEEVEQKTQQEEQKTQQEDTSNEGTTNNDQIQHDESQLDNGAEEENVQIEKQVEKQDQSLQTSENDNKSKTHQGKKRKKKQQKSVSDPEDGSFPSGESSGIPKESKESKKAWSTQADQSESQKERRKGPILDDQDGSIYGYSWQLCNVTAGADYIPCLDNEKAISKLRSRKHFEHRERHCPEDPPTCLVPLPQGYKRPVEWPHSRDKIWYHNVPHLLLAEVKGHQNWVKLTGEFLTFPGGGTQFIHGALHYIDFIQQAVPEIAWGKHTRTVLDVGCGVASFGGYLFDRDVLTISFAPKDEHEAQVQFALERGIPAISAVMGSQRLPFPSRVFDVIHCARCRVPWHAEGGALLLELNRMLRPGGYFVWSATPVYQKLQEDVEIWKAMSALTVSMCWELVTIKKDKLNMVGVAIYHKPDSNECYEERNNKNPPMCKPDDDPNAAWYVPLQSCMHRVPVDEGERGSQWPQEWPRRLQAAPYWLNRSQMGIYGKPAPDDFVADYEHWQRVVSKSYLSGLGISWSNVRNIMDMRAVYGGFAAALKDLKVWVLNVVNIDSPDTLPIIYERGLFGIYHDWCESFSTYPRTYDLLHADHLFSRLKKRCKIAPVMAEIDRIVRPGGKLIVRDESSAVGEVENLLKSLHWEVHLTFSKNQEGILSAQKSDWRPDSYAASS